MRLSVFIAKSGICSRRRADEFIRAGVVTVNGEVISKPFFTVSDSDVICFKGKVIKQKNQVYFLFNKPKGVITTYRDIFAGKKIIDFFPGKYKGIFPVGRLDKNSSGLIIITNDGDLCYKLTHPKFKVKKEYLLTLRGQLNEFLSRKAKNGVVDMGERLKVEDIKIISTSSEKTIVRVIIREGKKRHLRRLFSKLGLPVKDLKRTAIDQVKLGSLKPGSYRMVKREVIL